MVSNWYGRLNVMHFLSRSSFAFCVAALYVTQAFAQDVTRTAVEAATHIAAQSTVQATTDTPPVASAQYRAEIARFYGLKSIKHFTLLPVKGYQQTEDYTCGPAAVMSLLHYYGVLNDSQMTSEMELKIAKEMGVSRETGASPQQMVAWLEKHGFDVTSGVGGTIAFLQENLKQGKPTLVEWIDWGGHWVVATGYNVAGSKPSDDKDSLFFADPSVHWDNERSRDGLLMINPDRFDAMWFDAQYFKPGQVVKGIYIVAVPKKKSEQQSTR